MAPRTSPKRSASRGAPRDNERHAKRSARRGSAPDRGRRPRPGRSRAPSGYEATGPVGTRRGLRGRPRPSNDPGEVAAIDGWRARGRPVSDRAAGRQHRVGRRERARPAATVVPSLAPPHPLDAVDVPAAQVTAGAGVTIERLQRHARDAGWTSVSTGRPHGDRRWGGGDERRRVRVVRFGTMRTQVMGVQAVLADGTVVDDLRGPPKETVGPHLPSLLCGSEGTLAVITAAGFASRPVRPHRCGDDRARLPGRGARAPHRPARPR